jgi:hypothetical protein
MIALGDGAVMIPAILGLAILIVGLAIFSYRRWRGHAETTPPKGMVAIKNVPALVDPILLFMESPAFVQLLEQVPSWKVVHVSTLAEFFDKLKERKYAVLIAMSPEKESAAARRAIEAFRSEYPDALTVYHGWDYRLSVTGPRALKCRADAVMVGGVTGSDMIFFLGTALIYKSRVDIQPSQELYERLLKLTCASSPFWELQNNPMPSSEIE